MRAFILIIILLASFGARADVYRWVDEKGVIHYGDKPPKEGLAPVDLPPLQTYSPSATRAAAARSESSPNPSAPTQGSIRIVSPADGDTIRDAGGSISMVVEAALQQGQGLAFFLDGVQQNKVATPSSAWLFENIERGEHQLGAAIVGASGQVLVTAAPVTVHVKPPMVLR